LIEKGTFCLPQRIDFRGRFIALPHYNYARGHTVRGVVRYAEPLPIGEEGTWFLMSHVAAKADGWRGCNPDERPSKLSFGDRLEWVRQKESLIREFVSDIKRGVTETWGLPNKPTFFVGGCLELVDALDAGYDFPTTYPIPLDGCCNGAQHLAAMVRSEPEARLVNLIRLAQPSDLPVLGRYDFRLCSADQ
jgi:DNA-directed RNA polymerase